MCMCVYLGECVVCVLVSVCVCVCVYFKQDIGELGLYKHYKGPSLAAQFRTRLLTMTTCLVNIIQLVPPYVAIAAADNGQRAHH